MPFPTGFRPFPHHPSRQAPARSTRGPSQRRSTSGGGEAVPPRTGPAPRPQGGRRRPGAREEPSPSRLGGAARRRRSSRPKARRSPRDVRNVPGSPWQRARRRPHPPSPGPRRTPAASGSGAMAEARGGAAGAVVTRGRAADARVVPAPRHVTGARDPLRLFPREKGRVLGHFLGTPVSLETDKRKRGDITQP